MDAIRVSDKETVLLKRVDTSVHPYETSIGQYFSTGPASADPRNHCCPIYDVLQDPMDVNTSIVVMPHMRRYIDPDFQTVGEAVEYFRQIIEVWPSLFGTFFLSSALSRDYSLCTSTMSPIGLCSISFAGHSSLIWTLQRLHDTEYYDGCSSHVSRRVSSSGDILNPRLLQGRQVLLAD